LIAGKAPSDSLRRLRGFIYRVLPGRGSGAHRLRATGYARRWGAEEKGWNQDEFSRICWERLLERTRGDLIMELAAGDGLVGSLGNWLEKNHGWKAVCFEARPGPAEQLKKFRPAARIAVQPGPQWFGESPHVVTSRNSLGNSALVRALKQGVWRPELVGLWNRSGRDLWFRRMRFLGYRLALCQDRLEIYQRGKI